MGSNIPITAFERKQIEQIRLWVDANVDQKISATMLALKAGVSVYKLNAGFRQLFGVTANHYVKKQRMEKAARLLVDSRELVNSIGKECGYKNEAAFYRAFRAYYGVTPDRFRRR